MPGQGDDHWVDVARISPRSYVRTAVVDDTGQPVNSYAATADIDGPCPDTPWAVILTDHRQRFHLICFDLDAGGNVDVDLARLTGWLTDLAIEHTVAASGPAGGRHVWLSLIDPIPATQVRALAATVGQLLPTLDKAPLTNPGSGCVRPPGSPHRHGGRSTVITGPTPLLRPAVTSVQIDALHEIVLREVDKHPVTDLDRPSDRRTGDLPLLPIDRHRAPYLPGPRRPLPPASAVALDTIPRDPSAALWTVLLGAVRARWHREDILDRLTSAAGLEHLRTRNEGTGRTRALRSPAERRQLLTRKWEQAVTRIASSDQSSPHSQPDRDDTFPERAATAGDLVDRVQARADASPGRWATRTGPGCRLVLDALCSFVLAAVTATVEADVRRLAMATGLGRETVRQRLQDLARDGWISLAAPAAGRRAHHWILTTPPPPPAISLYPQHHQQTRSQVGTPPAAAPTLRSHWTTTLTNRLEASTHDVFTPQGLGTRAGYLYRHLGSTSVTVTELVRTTNYDLAEIRSILDSLARYKLISVSRTGIRAAKIDRRAAAASRLGATGVLEQRAAAYTRERVLWEWWCSELEWMRLPAAAPGKRRYARISLGQLGLDTGRPHGPMPRTDRGRVDHQYARSIVNAA